MKISEVLKKYNVHSRLTSTSAEVKERVYEDISIEDFVFTPYELDCNFLEVHFEKCDFSNVYLGSIWLCGSIFESCILNANSFIKGKADYVEFINSKIEKLNLFRTDCFNMIFRDTYIDNSKIDNCCFNNATFASCKIENVIFSRINFENSTFKDVKFIKCRFCSNNFNAINGINDIEFIDCNFTTQGGVELCSDLEIKNYIKANFLNSI